MMVFFILACNDSNKMNKNNEINDCLDSVKNLVASDKLGLPLLDYVHYSQEIVQNLNESDIKKLKSHSNQPNIRSKIISCMISLHEAADSVAVSESGTSISFYDKKNKRWLNILVNTR